jgi:hypothetical protein
MDCASFLANFSPAHPVTLILTGCRASISRFHVDTKITLTTDKNFDSMFSIFFETLGEVVEGQL